MKSKKTTYEIGTRLRGFSKDHFKNLAKNEENNELLNKKYVPHITFMRPFHLKENSSENQLIEKFSEFCQESNYELLKFSIKNPNYFPNEKKTIYAEIEDPENKIEKFVRGLEKKLSNLIEYKNPIIKNPGDPYINLHVSLFQSKNEREFKKAFSQIYGNIDLPIEQYLLRTHILKKENGNKQILQEYDFCLEKALNRKESLDKKTWRNTMNSFRNKTKLKPSPEGFKRISK